MDKGRQQNSKIRNWITVWQNVSKISVDHKLLKKRIYVKRQQHAYYNKLKEKLGKNEVLLLVEYSENYSNIQQGEIQCTYIGHDSFSIFTTCCYLLKMVTLSMKISQ